MKITGLVVWTQDNTLSVKFYKKLGFEAVSSDNQISVVRLGNFTITLVSMRDDVPFERDAFSGDKGRGAYLYIHVDDVDDIYRELIQKGIKPHTEPRDWDWGNREFIVKDPDGYKLCFWQKLA